MAQITLEGIEVYAFHGYSKEERTIGGKYRVDLTLTIDTSAAEKSDKLADTLNYEKVFEIVNEQMSQPSKLLEHIGRKILDAIAGAFPQLEKIDLRISKLHPPLPGIMKSVALELEYKR
jgi:dihydroneopterin aldolase